MTTKPNQRKRPVNDENVDPLVEANEEAEDEQALNGVLPLTRVKKLIKMSALSSSTVNVSAGAAKLIQLCAEEYLRAFARTSRVYAEQAGRKTIQLKDLNRVIKDDWAFALLEDALIEWPNDTRQQKLELPKLQANETDSSSLFHRAPRPLNQVVWQQDDEPDSVMTSRDIVEGMDQRNENDLNSEFNDTDIDFLELDNQQLSGKPTPKPTMEYLRPQSGASPTRLADTLTFEDDEENDEDADAQRPFNSKFLNSRRLDENDEDNEEELEDSGTLTPPPHSPNEFDLEDIGNF